jgi:hypothetical protein
VAHSHIWLRCGHASTNVGRVVHVHQTVWALTRKAKQASRTVVFEAACENAAPRAVEGRSDGVTRASRHPFAIEFEGECIRRWAHDASSGKNDS